MDNFLARALPTGVGSMPMRDHQAAVEVIARYLPQLPFWPQLSQYRQEGMINQFAAAMPGLRQREKTPYIDVTVPEFDHELVAFYEEYLAAHEAEKVADESRFSMGTRESAGFFALLETLHADADNLIKLKGQVTGPVTFCMAVKDHDGRAIFYNEQLRDAAVKMLALKARWQAQRLARLTPAPIIFLDEPGLAGFGSSAFITVSAEEIVAVLSEVVAAVHQGTGLAGVHVCANTEWPLIFEAGADIVNFDAFGYFDKFMLYPEQLRGFLARGGIIAGGIVPTSPDDIGSRTAEQLVDLWFSQAGRIGELGVELEQIFNQSLITPSCGLGTVGEEQAVHTLGLTRAVSDLIRQRFG
jgi:methionine synthase II (cobalamin-independent)